MAEKKKNKLYLLDIIIGILLIVLAVFLMPLWKNVDVFWSNWGLIVVNLIVAAFLSMYIFGFVIKKIGKTHNKTVNLLTIIEFSLLMLVDLFLILGQWIPSLKIIPVNNACAVVGLALYIRGVVEIFRAYFFRLNTEKDNKDKYPLWWLCIAIVFVTIGMWMMLKPLFTDEVIVWIFSVFLLCIGLFLIFYGIFTKPKKSKKK